MQGKALIFKVFNPFLISRFLAKNIDLLLGQLIALIILMNGAARGVQLNPMAVSLGMFLVTIILEALSLYYFKLTPGKFFMGLRVYPDSLTNSFKRSFSCYFRALGLGIPVLGLIFSLAYYLLGVNNKPIPWDKYGQITQTRKHFLTGMVSALVVNALILILVSSLQIKPSSEPTTASINKVSTLETIVDYPGFEEGSRFNSVLTEREQSISDIWNMSCRLGAVGLLDYFKGPLLEQRIEIISMTCERGIEMVIDANDDVESIYMKACSYGIGVGAALMFQQDMENSPLSSEAEAEKILKAICLPAMGR
jgi:hypothetical protein